ncbi:MAG: hypothetical protein HOJ15_03320 [Candidatus Jacksonbacteria bacterium]|jgi:hypothetical protein|nr:hypothetical protein [Candidatus Jacksonbacteria bacterium]MBT6301429.1 hypothetical protein [Candidatus Jacksonbacteria bacterium]MBT6756786.1 hypothetical protein [Candidatus Jacksonbacteria bacterium]MBT6955560.1 hypothetical protein [Candidatus Jacksonbacteria bacterium]MBT7008000.1 hypothetical protein [Candidatus Jacksonbacteria bacterium]
MSSDPHELLEQYHPLNKHEISASMWWLNHRKHMRLVLIIAVAVLIVLFWTLSIWWGVNYIFSSRSYTQSLLAPGGAFQAVRLSAQAIDVQISSVTLVKGSKSAQIVWSVRNPNVSYIANTSFRVPDALTQKDLPIVRLYPGQTQWFSVSAATSLPSVNSSDISVNVDWQRVQPMDKELLQNLSAVSVANVRYIPAQGVALPGITFDIKNTAVTGFWESRVAVVASAGNTVYGVSDTLATELLPEEQKAISFAWDGPALPSGIQIQAFSYVDVLDENIEIELPSPIRTEF